jgi:hypothetical protein
VAAKNRENFSTNQWIEFQQAELKKYYACSSSGTILHPKFAQAGLSREKLSID